MSRIEKINFFIESPFNQRDYSRLGIELLERNGFMVEVWEFTPFLHPEVHEKVKVPDPVSYDNHHVFKSKREVLNAILKLNHNTFIIFFMGYYFKAYEIYRAVSKRNLKYANFMAIASPLPLNNEKNKAGIDKILRRIKQITPDKLCNFIFAYIPFKLLGIKAATLNLAGGEESICLNYPVDSNTEILWLHTFDYDLYLEHKNKTNELESNIGVFLDEYLPFHPDYIHHGLSAPSTAEEYYPSLCNFFDLIEKRYNLKIVIAAHPRSKYTGNPDYFCGREVIKGQTIELVKKSAFVILHASTAVNFAILFDKPCIFITTEKISNSYLGPYIKTLSSVLSKDILNLNNDFSCLEQELVVDNIAYRNYKNAYIKKNGTEELPFWQIFANRLKKLDA